MLIDLAQTREQPVPESSAQKLCHQIGGIGYVESSALTQKNLKEVFDRAIVAAMHRSPSRNEASEQFLFSDTPRSRRKSRWKRFCCCS